MRGVEQDLEDAVDAVLTSGVATGELADIDARLYARNILWTGYVWLSTAAACDRR